MKFCNTISRKNNLLFLFFFFLFSSQLSAQVSTSSPYSRYGVGDLQFGGFSKNLGMGGVALALSSPYYINFSNPASYTALSMTSFEAAATAGFYELKNSTGSGFPHNASFGYFSLGFPLKFKKAGMSLGLIPYSNVGYDISNQRVNAAGDIELHKYEGSGGLNQFYVGAGWAPTKSFSVGVNVSFMFGTLNQVRRVEFPFTSNYNTKINEETIVNDFYYSLGILKTFDSLVLAKSDSLVLFDRQKEKINDSLRHVNSILGSATEGAQKDSASAALLSLQAELLKIDSLSKLVVTRKQKSGWSLSIGLTGAPSARLKGKHTVLTNTYRYDFNENEITKDTAVNIEDKNGKLILPFSVGAGIALMQGTRWTIGTDFSLQNWKDYSLFGDKDSLANSWRLAAGFQWIPNDRSIKSYFSLIHYRLGFHYEQTYLQVHSTQLNDMGVSIGFGFPMKRAATTVHISAEAGRRGAISNNLIEVNYLKCSIAFTLNDRWFIKPKFD